MKTVAVKEDLMRNHVVDQLNEFGYTDTDGKKYRELVSILARLRAMEVEISDPGQNWF